MDEMTTLNVKGVARSDEPTENYHIIAVPLCSMEHFSVFLLIVLVLWPATSFSVQHQTADEISN